MSFSNKKLLLIPVAFIFFAAIVSAASVTTSLYYDSTTQNSLQIYNGASFGIIVSAGSALENNMTITVNIFNSAGQKIGNILTEFTKTDSYSNHIILDSSSYQNPGNYTINSTVIAGSGQKAVSTLNLEVLPLNLTNHPPVITVISPTNNQILTSSSVLFSIATDKDCSAAWYSLNNSANVTLPKITTTSFMANVSLADGSHSLVFYAENLAGNIGKSSTITFSVNTSVPPVNTPPVVVISSPQDGSTYNSQVTEIDYTATSSSLNQCWYSLDQGVTNITVACNVAITGISSVDGTNVWTVYASDTFGNIGSETVTFTVNTGTNGNGGSTGGIPLRTITPYNPTSDFETQQYLNQFAPKTAVQSQAKTPVKATTSIWTIIGIILFVLILIIIVFLIYMSMRE